MEKFSFEADGETSALVELYITCHVNFQLMCTVLHALIFRLARVPYIGGH